MKQLLFIFMLILIHGGTGTARDFIVEFAEENYKETRVPFSYAPLVYHSVQINSPAGPKMLILTGEDAVYRKWLRYYMSKNTHFIVKVDPAMVDRFISSKVYETDVSAIHPYEPADPPEPKIVQEKQDTLKGENYFLVIDTSETRKRLFRTVSEKMGFAAISLQETSEAVKLFLLQPEKFKMIVVHHTIPKETATAFVDKILSIKHDIPVLVETGYGNRNAREALTAKYSAHRTVHVKPVVLNDLQNTIKNLVLSTNA